MRTRLFCAALAAVCIARGGDIGMKQGQPVLVELFTSEGCSSCPPADRLLERLDRDPTVAGAQTIVLSEHVDYWNHLGWRDPFSSAAFSQRQAGYARRFGIEGPYTPQMIVDGSTEFVGSDAAKAESAIRQAAQHPKTVIRLQPVKPGGELLLEVDPLPRGKGEIYLARALDRATSSVQRGENEGRTLRHVAVVQDLQQIGSIGTHGGFRKSIPAPAQGSRLVIFVQEGESGPVLGAAMYASPHGGK